MDVPLQMDGFLRIQIKAKEKDPPLSGSFFYLQRRVLFTAFGAVFVIFGRHWGSLEHLKIMPKCTTMQFSRFGSFRCRVLFRICFWKGSGQRFSRFGCRLKYLLQSHLAVMEVLWWGMDFMCSSMVSGSPPNPTSAISAW